MSNSRNKQLELLRELAVHGPSDERLAAFRESVKDLPEAALTELMNEYAVMMEAGNIEAQVDDGMLAKMQERVAEWNEQESEGDTRQMPRLYRWVAAAVVIITAGIGYYWWVSGKEQPGSSVEIAREVNIPPGKEGAILTLGDGKKVVLDSIKNGTVASQEGVTATVINGALAYEGMGNTSVYNTMSTPKGRQYKLSLPDGSVVWLNAASSIRYPTVFNGKDRKVELEGEAYFEVKKNAKQPFIVNARNKAEIEVLGTSFNVNAYTNEQALRTTLIDGSVKVNGTLLKPGQQAGVTDKVQVTDHADTEKVMAWQRGFFNFDNASLEEVMRQLERWYDIEVVYEKGIPTLGFGGEMSMQTSLGGILVALEKSGIRYKLEGKKLIILSK